MGSGIIINLYIHYCKILADIKMPSHNAIA